MIEARRGPALKIALGLQIGFLWMTGRLLEAVRIGAEIRREIPEENGILLPALFGTEINGPPRCRPRQHFDLIAATNHRVALEETRAELLTTSANGPAA